ncbi:DeoR/GlpR transcriptional regulator [Tuanshanicoccus lijuaniae]|uniref:DeoR/GlpR family DNA-binding transcription regulator n=1 Tax=Aerococcaceae bacterium zg-1292 TaxID=2774330 RepID=UPI0019378CB3|nr:DeoR/GlpR transcriptional regulator [Aerococcaceae bacterium zg-1292]QQA37754.1 DeoR/GlpR transcriptional regulator [Aerococcaceae bacterium zg-1292]
MKQRQSEIVNYLKINQFASVRELQELVNYSEATIKRDLISLEKDGLIRRTRGGAIIIDDEKIDVPYLMKLTKLNEDVKKKYIANLAQPFIKDDMTIFIDSSTTCLHLVNVLSKFEGLKIITNGVLTAVTLSEFTNAEISVIGGQVVHKRATINGSRAYSNILNYYADIAFVSCRGFDIIEGAFEVSEGEALIKQGFRSQANKLILLMDSSKIGKMYTHKSLKINEIDYILVDEDIDIDNKIQVSVVY